MAKSSDDLLAVYQRYWALFWIVVGIIVLYILWRVVIYPPYMVWHQQMMGKARYAEAESSRQIAVLEARARQESARYDAESEITRAKGVAEANKIIGSSLRGNEAYLRYLWIQNLDKGNSEVIYVPTEAGLPMLEASRLLKPKKD